MGTASQPWKCGLRVDFQVRLRTFTCCVCPRLSSVIATKATLLGKVQVIVQPPPCVHSISIQAWRAIGQRSVEPESPDGCTQNDDCCNPPSNEGLTTHPLLGGDEPRHDSTSLSLALGIVLGLGSGRGDRIKVEDKFDQSASHKRRCKVSREVVVQEALTTHKPEWEVVRRPAQEQEARAIVQTGAGAGAPD